MLKKKKSYKYSYKYLATKKEKIIIKKGKGKTTHNTSTNTFFSESRFVGLLLSQPVYIEPCAYILKVRTCTHSAFAVAPGRGWRRSLVPLLLRY